MKMPVRSCPNLSHVCHSRPVAAGVRGHRRLDGGPISNQSVMIHQASRRRGKWLERGIEALEGVRPVGRRPAWRRTDGPLPSRASTTHAGWSPVVGTRHSFPVLEAAVWAVAKSPLRDGAGGRAGAAVKGGAEHGNATANQRGWNTLPLVERERAAATTSPRQSFFSPPSGRAATPAALRASARAGGTCDLGVLRFPRSMRAVLGTSVVPVHRKARDQGSRALACSGRIDWLLDQAGRKRASSVFSARVLEQRPCQASPYVMVNHSDQTG